MTVHFSKLLFKQIGTLLISVVFLCQEASVVSQVRWGDASPCLASTMISVRWCCQRSSSASQVPSCTCLLHFCRPLTQLLKEWVLLAQGRREELYEYLGFACPDMSTGQRLAPLWQAAEGGSGQLHFMAFQEI